MSDSDSDEDLKLAIAMSLQDQGSTPNENNQAVIDLVSDDDDVDDDDLDAPLKTTVALKSTQKQKDVIPRSKIHDVTDDAGVTTSKGASIERSPRDPPKPSIGNASTGLLGLNRKQMEEERLARLGAMKGSTVNKTVADDSRKRKADASSEDSLSGRNVKAKISTLGQSSDRLIVTEPIRRIPVISGNVHSNGAAASVSGIQYPDGIVKKTWVKGFPRDGNDIKIEEVLQKDDLELAVLSAFQIDAEWISSKLYEKTKVVWVLQAKSEAEKANWRDQAPNNYRFCFPTMDGIVNCMHSKLQLLAHSGHLRICIPSANLVPYDWGETGVMENVCFLIDLPRLPSGQTAELTTEFAKELVYFMTALGLEQKIVDSLKKFDFSRTADIEFVHSIGGSHTSSSTGYCGLGEAVQRLGSATQKALEIDFLTASIGNLTEEFIRTMYLACQGDDGYRLPNAKSTRAKGEAEAKKDASDVVLTRCRVYFPTEQTIFKSKGGTGAGGTICFQEKFYNSGKFPKEIMYDSLSKREGLLMHSKMIFIRSPKKALCYVGSHNLSEAAWGKLVKDRTTKEPKLNCRNWECGVLLPISSPKENLEEPLGMEVFDGVVPVPMEIPADPWGTRKPWYFSQY